MVSRRTLGLKLFRRFERPASERWPGRAAFLAVGLGGAVGWMPLMLFPATALKHSGGAFVVAYSVALVFLALPMLKLEAALGHRAQRAAPRAFRNVGKRWEWLGWWGTVLAALLAILMTVVGAWALMLVADASASVIGVRPSLDVLWEGGSRFGDLATIEGSGGTAWGLPSGSVLAFLGGLWIALGVVAARGAPAVATAVRWVLPVAGVLAIAFVGRFLIGGLVADHGLVHGLAWALTPDVESLANVGLWTDAVGLAVLALLLGTGAYVALCSTLPRSADVINSASLIGVLSAAAVFIGFLGLAGLLGYYALADQRQVADVLAASGSGDSAIAVVTKLYPQAFAMLAEDRGAEPGGSVACGLWAIALFASLAAATFASAQVLVYSCVSAIREKFAITRRDAGVLTVGAGFLLAAVAAGVRDVRWLDAVRIWTVQFGVVPLLALECLCVGWVAGTTSLKQHCNWYSERRLGIAWDAAIKFVVPGVLALAFAHSVVTSRPWPGLEAWAATALNVALTGAALAIGLRLARRRPSRRTRRLGVADAERWAEEEPSSGEDIPPARERSEPVATEAAVEPKTGADAGTHAAV